VVRSSISVGDVGGELPHGLPSPEAKTSCAARAQNESFRQDVVPGSLKDVIETPTASLAATIDDGLAQLRAKRVQHVVVAGK
jgi:hypothetical protein